MRLPPGAHLPSSCQQSCEQQSQQGELKKSIMMRKQRRRRVAVSDLYADFCRRLMTLYLLTIIEEPAANSNELI